MDQKQDQRRNQKVPWNKWQWEHNDLKSVGHRESSPKRETHNIICLPQETRKTSNKQSNFTVKGLEKEQQNLE